MNIRDFKGFSEDFTDFFLKSGRELFTPRYSIWIHSKNKINTIDDIKNWKEGVAKLWPNPKYPITLSNDQRKKIKSITRFLYKHRQPQILSKIKPQIFPFLALSGRSIQLTRITSLSCAIFSFSISRLTL